MTFFKKWTFSGNGLVDFVKDSKGSSVGDWKDACTNKMHMLLLSMCILFTGGHGFKNGGTIC